MEFRVSIESGSWDLKTRRDGRFRIAGDFAGIGKTPMSGFAGTWGTKSKYSPLGFEPTGVGVIGLREFFQFCHLVLREWLEVGGDVDVFGELLHVIDADNGGADG